MTWQDILQLILYFGLLTITTPILGMYMARVFMGKSTPFTPILSPIERGVYRLAGINPTEEQDWRKYALSLLIFNIIGFVMVFALQLLQGVLPLNPANIASTSPHLAFNIATSFMTNTNWQAYGGETTMSYLTQMMGLAVQNFLSASTGIAVMVALARGLANKSSKILGNFWSDMVKSTLYVLLPLSMVLAVILIGQGVVQNLNPYVEAQTLSGATQYLPQG
ncbi:MAG: potassium-transporting ATPase subunit KdpA, partial [Anaerolineae bacterium]|nr:potassium-transporting ATPase subunit KdpA [Anaerolineae bacterium]